MAVTVVLTDTTPYLLKYLCTATSASTASPTFDTHVVIPNGLFLTPDLATDALAAVSGGGFPGSGPYPLQRIMNARRNGYGPLAVGVALTQAQARALLASDDPANAVLTNRNILSAEMFMTPRTVPLPGLTSAIRQSWFCDAEVDVSGDPIVRVGVTSRPTAPMTAYLTIRCRTSPDL